MGFEGERMGRERREGMVRGFVGLNIEMDRWMRCSPCLDGEWYVGGKVDGKYVCGWHVFLRFSIGICGCCLFACYSERWLRLR